MATLIGENPAEWNTLEDQARAGRWTIARRAEVERLRTLASSLGVPLREEGLVPERRRQVLSFRRSRRRRDR